MYVRRAIESRLGPAGSAHVVILSGARAVGKTTLVSRLVANRTYQHLESLADPTTRSVAAQDPVGWLTSLPDRTVIDEAQLVDGLSLAIKRVVDDLGTGRRYLLTGSASIGRHGLGGADPLAGRSRRYELHPLTDAELAGHDPAGVVTTLFDRSPQTFLAARAPLSLPLPRTALAGRMKRGGFPALALSDPSPRERDEWVDATVAATITDEALPGERFDTRSATAVLDACLRNPAGILNTASLADRLQLDPRTVDRYLDVLERRFLLYHLPNLATSRNRQQRARAKIYPVDSAFAARSLARAGHDIESDPSAFGQLLECYVVGSLLAAAQCMNDPIRPFYWRTPKPVREVDLVLLDDRERAVGIEIKAAGRVRPEDCRGLRALAGQMELHAGYIVYTGDQLVQLDERIWALPVDNLLGISSTHVPGVK